MSGPASSPPSPVRPSRLSPRWATALALVVVFGLGLLVHRRIVFGGELPAAGDGLRLSLPERAFMVAQLRGGHLPLWQPLDGLGTPFFANLTPGVLHPLNLLYAVLPLGRAFGWNVVLASILAGLGLFVLARRLGFSRPGALVGAAAFGFGGALVTQTNLQFLVSNATVPWAVAALVVAMRRPTPGTLLMGALAPALVLFGGDPQSVVAAFALALVPAFAREAPGRARAFGMLVACAAGAALVGAVQLFPALEAYLASARAHVDYSSVGVWSLPPLQLANLVTPGLFFGRDAERLLSGGSLWLPSVFVGPAVVLLAVVGALRDRRARPWLGAALAGLWVALGPAYGLSHLLGWLPVWRSFEYTAKVTPFALLALAVAAAAGLDAIREASRRELVAGAGAVAMLLGLGVVAIARGEALVTPATVGGLVAAAGLTLALVAGRRSPGLVVALAVLPPAFWNAGAQSLAPASVVLQPPWAVARLQALSPEPRLFTLRGAEAAPVSSALGTATAREALEPAFNEGFGIESLDLPYHPFFTPGYERVLPAAPSSLRRARIYGASFLLTEGGVQPGSAWSPVGIHPALPLMLWRIDRHLPRAFVAPSARAATSQEAAIAAIDDRSFAPGRGVVVECPVTAADEAVVDRGTVRIERSEANRTTLRADLRSPAFVVLNDGWFPGWRARVDGAPADICRANALVRAVRVPAGSHRIDFVYAPGSLVAGAWTSALALLILAGAALIRRLVASRRTAIARAIGAVGEAPAGGP